MPLKTVQDVMQSHQEFLQKVAEQINTVKQGRPLSTDLSAREQEALLAQASTRLDTVRKAKAAAAQRFDEEIQQQEAVITQLKATAGGGGVSQATSSPGDVTQTPQVKAALADVAQASQAVKAEVVEAPAAKKARKAKPRPAARKKT